MYQVTTRPITAEDEARLTVTAPFLLRPGVDKALQCIPIALAAVLVLAIWRDLLAVTIAVVVCGPTLLWRAASAWRAWRAARSDSPVARADCVEVHRVQSRRVLAVHSDDVIVWAFDVGNDRLFLWATSSESQPNWPNTDFEVLRIAGSDLLSDPLCTGLKMDPIATIDDDRIDLARLSEDGPLIAGSLDTFERDFARA